ncbi:MAG TPA: LapA family protein [Kiritimatiellia bacterium]|nr:LapA family protein [Kiritimatiellia bacterium]
MKSIKFYAVVALLILASVVTLQNARAVSIRFLVWDMSLSLAILLPVTLSVGFLIGYILSRLRR